ncbi:MAG: hypothetical protein IJT98_09805 [Prevotella sp.]|nr:hypothetical protein [Prevotella sp.]
MIMRAPSIGLFFVLCSLFFSPVGAPARQLYIHPGDDPKAAIESLLAGDTLWVQAGVYDNISDIINVRHSGTRTHRICVFGYGEGRAVLDFKNQPHTGDDAAGQFRGVLMNPCADYWYWRDIDFTHAADNGMKLEASYCVIERCNFYRNGDTGLQLGFDKDGNGNNIRNRKFLYCRYNQIINCDSYYNYDVQSHGGNADGFANKLYPGPGNEWHGDRCWGNSDDGWDLYYAAYPCLIDNCWAIWNGYLEDGSVGVNGNGFKQGGNKQGGGSYGAHIFTNCVAAYNLYHGFDQNNHNEGNWIINCTAFANKQVNFRFNCDVDMLGNTVFHLRNCLGFRPGEANHRFGDMWPDSEFTSWQDLLGVSPQYNMGKGTNPATGQEYKRISAKDWPDYDDQFEDISLETALSARQPNGELPLHFARPKAGCIFEDRGTPIQDLYCSDVFQDSYRLAGQWLDDYSTTITLPFYGAAPDYGAYEAGWERPAYNLQTLPVNDGTLFATDEAMEVDGQWYRPLPLVDDELFQSATLSDSTAQYVTSQASGNKLLPDYYGKSGTYPTKIGSLYGGGTRGALMLAKSTGYIEFTLPSLMVLRSMLYGGGKNSSVKVQWRRPSDSSWTDGESYDFDQRIHTLDFTCYGLPVTAEPVVVRISSTGSNDVYLTDLTITGCQPVGGSTEGISLLREQPAFSLTAQGIIVYGDVQAISVYNAAGQQVAFSALSQFCSLSSLPAGIYAVQARLRGGNTVAVKVQRQ